MYNTKRFNEILINVTDYDMPEINGIEVTKTMEFNADTLRYAHIFLTGKASNDFKQMVKNKDYIGKDDAQFIDHLLQLIEEKAIVLFSNYSYEVALKLARDPDEKAVVLLDGNFCSVFNSYLNDHNICEFYLFDKQGSYVMLDADSNPSWFFVRNETGMENSIRFAKERHAPQEVLDALESRKLLLSLYDKTDINTQTDINWDDYLLPSKRFESDGAYFESYPDLMRYAPTIYYYAHSNSYGGKGVERSSLLSYRDFLNQID